jgi:hypothetical protein
MTIKADLMRLSRAGGLLRLFPLITRRPADAALGASFLDGEVVIF